MRQDWKWLVALAALAAGYAWGLQARLDQARELARRAGFAEGLRTGLAVCGSPAATAARSGAR